MGRVDAERLGVWQAFLRVHATLTQVLEAELLEAQDLPLSWYDVLVSLNGAAEGRVRMQELAARVMFSRSGLTRLVDRMTDAGLVAREPCPGDRRGTFAVITAEGRGRLRAASGVHLRGVYEHFARHLDDRDVAAMLTALGHLLDAGGNAS
jgi:DNA-binding MarR family transcriptional regulator